MKKISLFKSLAILGAVTLTSVCATETVLLFLKNSNDAKIDISTLNGQILDRIQVGNVLPQEQELLNLLKDAGVRPLSGGQPFKLTNISDILIVSGSIQNNSFQIVSVPNSITYEANKTATIYLNIPSKTQLSSIITSTPDLYLDKYENETVTKAQILKDLQTRYIGLNINHLEVINIVHHGDNEINTADVVAKNGSELYVGLAAVTYYTSGAAVVTYDKTTLVPGDANILPTFTFAGVTQTATYTCTNVVAPITFSTGTGAFAYGNSVDFNGGLYQVKASYSSGGMNFVAYTFMFAQANIAIGKLTIANPTINMTTKNSGTATYTVNGAAPSGGTVAYSISPTVSTSANNEGLSFNTSTGVLTWDGTTPTLGGGYAITCTYSGGNNKTSSATAVVTVKAQQDALITVGNSYIKTGALNSGTFSFTINGKAYTPTTCTATGFSTAEGITWNTTNRQVVWNGTTHTGGCVVTIVATYTLNNQVIRAETKVTVAESNLSRTNSFSGIGVTASCVRIGNTVTANIAGTITEANKVGDGVTILTFGSGYKPAISISFEVRLQNDWTPKGVRINESGSFAFQGTTGTFYGYVLGYVTFVTYDAMPA